MYIRLQAKTFKRMMRRPGILDLFRDYANYDFLVFVFILFFVWNYTAIT